MEQGHQGGIQQSLLGSEMGNEIARGKSKSREERANIEKT